ncbi:methyltransferase [Micromonospora ureilytica]|uniref:methyltransferase n=1 Tax=Micromonospora ureilytica TaxID=709868 RepID=UPI0033E74DC6
MTDAPPRPGDLLARLSDLVTPMALRVAATLRLADAVLAGVDDVDRLAGLTGTHPGALARLVRHLCAVGLFETDRAGRITVTALGRLLADDHPARHRSWLDLDQAIGRADLAFLHLLTAVRTGRPMYEPLYGLGFWDDLSANERLGDSFDHLMSAREGDTFAGPVAAYDWSGVRHVLDAGGAPGALAQAVVRAAPHVRATVLDLPGPAARTRRRIAEAGLADQVTVLDGDFREPLPVTADVVLLSFVLLNWDDEEACRILRSCARALEPGGRIVLLERAEPLRDATHDAADLYFTVLDLRMLVFLGGRVRTYAEWRRLAGAVGLRVEAITGPLSSPTVPVDSCLITLAPAG